MSHTAGHAAPPPAPRAGRLALHWQILIGLALGLALGMVLNQFGEQIRARAATAGLSALVDTLVNLNRLLGEWFKRGLQFIAVPIILLAMVLAVNSIGDLRKLGRLGAKTIGIFTCTALSSVVVGLALVNLIKPGSDRFIDAPTRARLLEQFPPDSASRIISTAKSTNPWDLAREAMPTNPFDALARADMLQVVVFALLLGIVLV